MTYDANQHYSAQPDGHGGVTLRQRARTRDARGSSFLPGRRRTRDLSPDVRHQVFFQKPGDHQRLEVERGADGSVRVILITPATPEMIGTTLEDLPTEPNGREPTTKEMNETARRHWANPQQLPVLMTDSTSEAGKLRAQNDAARKLWGI